MGTPDRRSRRWCSIATTRARWAWGCRTCRRPTGSCEDPRTITRTSSGPLPSRSIGMSQQRSNRCGTSPPSRSTTPHAVGADPGYTGLLGHNPACRFKSPYRTTWGREAPYTLDQLATVIPFNWEPPSVRQTGVGRNVDLFEAGIRWAGRRANVDLPLLPALMIVNQDFAHPLPMSEVQATARSIEKYRSRWAARGWHTPRWIARQAARGRASGEARRKDCFEATRPWEAAGVSRRTWYRRRKAERESGTRTNTDKGSLAPAPSCS